MYDNHKDQLPLMCIFFFVRLNFPRVLWKQVILCRFAVSESDIQSIQVIGTAVLTREPLYT